MRIGCCGVPYRNWVSLSEIGYDFIEGNFQQINTMSDEEFQNAKQALKESGLRVEVCNCFFPGNFVLYAVDSSGFNSDAFREIEEKLVAYCRHGLARVAELGCEIVVIGSGAARKIPDSLTATEAHSQLCRVLTIIADIAAEFGIKVTIEPLNKKETNMINTLSQSLDFLDELKHPNLLAMIDYYHAGLEQESFSSLDRAGDRLLHIHLCRADRYNCTMEDYNDLLPFVQHVLLLGYNGRLSLECAFKTDQLTGLGQSIEVMKLFKQLKK